MSPARTDLIEVNLREPTVTTHRWDDDRLAAVRDQLRLSIRAMKAYLADPDANLALVDGFERTEELRICRWCNFRAVCRPEISSEGGVPQASIAPAKPALGGVLESDHLS